MCYLIWTVLFNKVQFLKIQKLLSVTANAKLTVLAYIGPLMNEKPKKFLLFAQRVVLFFLLAFCARLSFAYQAPAQDPLERFNRATFALNDKLDQFILKPVAKVYNAVLPKPINQGIHNVFNNIGNLPTIANDLLQLDFYHTANDFWRLAINTTIGVGGLFDVAARLGLQPNTNDFGLTLARWGWTHSVYVVWPLWGPSTFRDGIGLPVDYYAFSIYPYIHPAATRYSVYGLGVVDRRAQLLQFENVLQEAAFDKYVFIRNAYMQRRAYQINQVQHPVMHKTVAIRSTKNAEENTAQEAVLSKDVMQPENQTIQKAAS